MRINNIILILITLTTIFIKGCNNSVVNYNINLRQEIRNNKIIRSKEIIKTGDYPYIANEILYTEMKSIPIKAIKRIDLDDESIKFFVLSYELDKYTIGMITMNYNDFKKIEKQLLGDTYENKVEETRKKEKSSIFSFFKNN